jgi:hypothetical protein
MQYPEQCVSYIVTVVVIVEGAQLVMQILLVVVHVLQVMPASDELDLNPPLYFCVTHSIATERKLKPT